jgi:UDP:flavonoid glycosyltransferase YjiC (YdhE family)
MVSSNAANFTEVVLDAVKKSGHRAVLATGWGGLDHEGIVQSRQMFFVRHAPHDWLFQRVSAAVHHGGAGTTAAAVRAGIPSVIVPFYGDQPFWARRLYRIGVAPLALDRKILSSDALAAALTVAQHPTMKQRAFELGCTVRAEDGVGEALRCLHGWGLLQQPAAEVAVHGRRTA